MKAIVVINAGICGFTTSAEVSSPDNQGVTFEIVTDCDKIRSLSKALQSIEPINAYQEINPAAESAFMKIVRSTHTGSCSGCVVPSGLFKAMQVAAGLALPKNISIHLEKA